jgi:hypothetical protein
MLGAVSDVADLGDSPRLKAAGVVVGFKVSHDLVEVVEVTVFASAHRKAHTNVR